MRATQIASLLLLAFGASLAAQTNQSTTNASEGTLKSCEFGCAADTVCLPIQ